MNTTKRKNFDSAKYFANINVPDDWESLEDFVEWYFESRMPLFIPYDAAIVRSDDACAVCVFRKGQYQVELYLIYPEMIIMPHAHPGIEVITVVLGGGSQTPPQQNGTSTRWGAASMKLMPGQFHGGDNGLNGSLTGGGFATLAFQKWDSTVKMTSAAVQWKGQILGPHQETLIRQHYPDALVRPGYADVTLPKEE